MVPGGRLNWLTGAEAPEQTSTAETFGADDADAGDAADADAGDATDADARGRH